MSIAARHTLGGFRDRRGRIWSWSGWDTSDLEVLRSVAKLVAWKDGTGMYLAFAELGVSNGQHAVGQIEVAAIETQCFVGSQAAGGIQTEERGKGGGSQTDRRQQLPCRLDQADDLLVTISVGRHPTIPVRKQIRWRHDGAWIVREAIPCEAAHHSQAVGPLAWLCMGRLGCKTSSSLM
jgi:hypothetical protein